MNRSVVWLFLAIALASCSGPTKVGSRDDISKGLDRYISSPAVPSKNPPTPPEDKEGPTEACTNKCAERFGYQLQTCYFDVGADAPCICVAIDNQRACTAQCFGRKYARHQC